MPVLLRTGPRFLPAQNLRLQGTRMVKRNASADFIEKPVVTEMHDVASFGFFAEDAHFASVFCKRIVIG